MKYSDNDILNAARQGGKPMTQLASLKGKQTADDM